MKCERECFNLFTKYGCRAFFRRGLLGDKWARKFVLGDTFVYFRRRQIRKSIKKYKKVK